MGPPPEASTATSRAASAEEAAREGVLDLILCPEEVLVGLRTARLPLEGLDVPPDGVLPQSPPGSVSG